MAYLQIIEPTFEFKGNKRKLAKELAEKVLGELRGFGDNSPQTAEMIYNRVKEEYPVLEEHLGLDAFRQHLSYLAYSDDSPITKLIGQHGYQLQSESQRESSDEISVLNSEEEQSEECRYRKSEELLYPSLKAWLMAQEYRVKDTSGMRERELGKWGNPDITGIKVVENLGSREIEIVTIEAKVKNVGCNFYEAVAHKRFANRAYFAFSSTKSLVAKSNDELRYLSDLFNVGVLLAIFDDDKYEQLNEGEMADLQLDEVDVYELYSPRFEQRQNLWQKKYCQAIGISDQESLWTWGESSSLTI